MKVGFVILHYNNLSATEKCLACLRKLNMFRESEIVIVDNASPNQSGNVLEKQYKSVTNVHVLINKENIGFAKGNNIGYCYAKKELGCHCIVVLNNDVYIEQENFIELVQQAFTNNTNYSIIAPDILAMKGFYQNPLSIRIPTKKYANQWYIKIKILTWFLAIPGLNQLVVACIMTKRNKNEDIKRRVSNEMTKRIMEKIVPHGACLIYGNSWVEREDIAFVPYTFLYAEEYLLSYYAMSKGYKCVFYPEIGVLHEAGASTKIEEKAQLSKLEFAYKNELYSIQQLKRLIKSKGRIDE